MEGYRDGSAKNHANKVLSVEGYSDGSKPVADLEI